VVSDEVKVGLGRTGRLHSFDYEGFVPDIVVYGKGLGSGLPISAIVGPKNILNCTHAFSLQTTQGNPVCAASGLAVLTAIEEEGLVQNAAQVGAMLKSTLTTLVEEFEEVADVRGRGLSIGVELVEDRASNAPAGALARQVVFRAYELGAVLYYVGMNRNVLELTPPLILSKTEASSACEIIRRAIADAIQGKVPIEKVKEYEGW
jgi:4-aminobutyrate aminotransferase